MHSAMEQYKNYIHEDIAAAEDRKAAQQNSHCLHIRCLVEWMPPAQSPAAEAQVVADTLVALPRTCPFVDIVPATLYYLGYNMTDIIGATGTVQMRNWKPVSCDVIADNPSATIDDVLGSQLASLTTLRIRLRSCFRPVARLTDDVKDKLLTYLFDRLRTTLAATGCPISDALLSQILRGEINSTDDRLSEATLRAFDQWFTTHVDSARHVSDTSRTDQQLPAVSDDSDTSSSPEDRKQVTAELVDHGGLRRSSSTEDLDVGSTIDDDKHDRLNAEDRSLSSQNFDTVYDHPPLLTKSAKTLPVLPNRNAVYVADAILPPETVEESRDIHYRNGVSGKSDYDSDHDVDLEVVLPSASPSQTSEAQEEMEFIGDNREDHVSTDMDTFSQEEATDLSLPKQNGDRKLSYVRGCRMDEKNGDAGTADNFSTGGSSSSEGGSGAQSPMMQAPPQGMVPPHNFLLNPSAAMAAAGLFSSSAPSLPPFYHHQRALQLAAMSRVAALGLPLHGKDVTPVASKPGMRSPHGHVPSVYSNSTLNIGAGYGLPTAKHGVSATSSPAEVGTTVKRSRVFIDPLTEIPRLERWFADDTHPSSYVIEKYTEELNRSPYRQRFPRLEPKNLQLWFKNHRAKMKRQRDACLAAAAAAAAAAASSANGGGRKNDDDKAEQCRFGQYQPGELMPPTSASVDTVRAFQKDEYSNVDGERRYSNGGGQTIGKHGGASFQVSTGRSYAVEDRQDASGGFFDQSSAGSGGSALDELVLRLRSGPLGRLPETTSLQSTSISCD